MSKQFELDAEHYLSKIAQLRAKHGRRWPIKSSNKEINDLRRAMNQPVIKKSKAG